MISGELSREEFLDALRGEASSPDAADDVYARAERENYRPIVVLPIVGALLSLFAGGVVYEIGPEASDRDNLFAPLIVGLAYALTIVEWRYVRTTVMGRRRQRIRTDYGGIPRLLYWLVNPAKINIRSLLARIRHRPTLILLPVALAGMVLVVNLVSRTNWLHGSLPGMLAATTVPGLLFGLSLISGVHSPERAVLLNLARARTGVRRGQRGDAAYRINDAMDYSDDVKTECGDALLGSMYFLIHESESRIEGPGGRDSLELLLDDAEDVASGALRDERLLSVAATREMADDRFGFRR